MQSEVAFRKKQKRSNLALYFYKTAGLTQALIVFKSHPAGLEIETDMVASATNNSSLATKELISKWLTVFEIALIKTALIKYMC